MAEAKLAGRAGVIDISSQQGVNKLQSKAVGLAGVLFLAVTGAAPMSAMLGNVPFAAGYGVGSYTPAAFLLATIVLTVFSIGYAAMASRVSSVGGFYSFISQGIGREVGMSAGIASFACYSIFEASLTGLFAFFGNDWLKVHLGINVPWLVLALIMLAVIAVLSYRDVKLSARILGIALISEVIMLAIFALGVLFHGGGTNLTGESLNVFHVFTPVVAQKVGTVDIPAGAAAVGIFMAFWSWVGFEMAPNYAEESRDPKRIVPQSLILSVIGLGVFYTFVSWTAVGAYPTEGDMLAKSFSDGVNFFLSPIKDFVGSWAFELMSLLILTSSFACGMAFHNTASRYMYSLGREGVLPKLRRGNARSSQEPAQGFLRAVGSRGLVGDPVWTGLWLRRSFGASLAGRLHALRRVGHRPAACPASRGIARHHHVVPQEWRRQCDHHGDCAGDLLPGADLAGVYTGRQSRHAGRHQWLCQQHSLCRPGDSHRRPGLGLCFEVGQSDRLPEHRPYGE